MLPAGVILAPGCLTHAEFSALSAGAALSVEIVLGLTDHRCLSLRRARSLMSVPAAQTLLRPCSFARYKA